MLVGVTYADKPDERAIIIDGGLDGGKFRKDAVIVSGSRFVMDGITMRGFSGNGVTTSKSSGVTLRNLVADKTGHYGVYPVESEDILVEDCVTTGINDAGIYVGQSRRATVRHNQSLATSPVSKSKTPSLRSSKTTMSTTTPPGSWRLCAPGTEQRRPRLHDSQQQVVSQTTSKLCRSQRFRRQLPYGIGIGVMAADGTVVEKTKSATTARRAWR